MSRQGREAIKTPAIDVDHVCEYFSGDQEMASMFLNLLQSDIASGSTSEVADTVCSEAPLAYARSCSLASRFYKADLPYLPHPGVLYISAGHCNKVLPRRHRHGPRLLCAR